MTGRTRSWSQTLHDIDAMKVAMQNEEEVIIAGDWHNDITWLMNVFPRARRASPASRTLLHLGDIEIGGHGDTHRAAVLNFIDERCRGNGIDRVLVTPGNHDNWDRITQKRAWRLGLPAPLSEYVWVLPRGYRFTIGDKTFMSFGGAASVQSVVDEGKNWWPAEVAPNDEYEAAGAAGFADVMLTHEAINGGPDRIEDIIHGKANGRWFPERLEASERSRALTTALFDAVRPGLLLHGHMHARGEKTLPDGRRIIALADNRTAGNVGILDVETLAWRWA
ncbi:calcineurin-like phosphoesterase family protein [Frondihabitans sp. PhB188]|uniref:metallophosphoesterase family protein n=1 Tax=Frondihabitans sp. PhB188 TaxID=2485200 RepID=UPI000FB679D5|nr:metallophosphoesterase family protein [Frondihabitans sp. PhB188]ROQ37064.1 calcineurin-like phosphoesterase family protein [Frondihabitans sp. PhB188]